MLITIAAVGGIITGVRAVYDITVWIIAHVASDVRDDMRV